MVTCQLTTSFHDVMIEAVIEVPPIQYKKSGGTTPKKSSKKASSIALLAKTCCLRRRFERCRTPGRYSVCAFTPPMSWCWYIRFHATDELMISLRLNKQHPIESSRRPSCSAP